MCIWVVEQLARDVNASERAELEASNGERFAISQFLYTNDAALVADLEEKFVDW